MNSSFDDTFLQNMDTTQALFDSDSSSKQSFDHGLCHQNPFNPLSLSEFTQEGSHQNFDPANPDGSVIGHPSYDMQFWHKQSFNDCDVVSQQMGLESLTAQHFSESALLHEAIKDGSHLSSGGTPANYIGHLYETHGFPIERHHEGTLDEIQQKLAEGQKIVVAVNSTVLWANETHIPEFGALSANHSVEVIGVVYPYSDHEHPKVILNDPGIDNGQGVMVPLEQFEQAWATSQHLIATTSLPDTHTVLRDSYDDMAKADLVTNRNALGVPSDSYQLEVAAQQRAQAMRERDASIQREKEYERERTERLAREQQVREEEARREQLREEQRREEALREQQQREREQQQREERQREEQRRQEEIQAQQRN